MEPDLGRIIIIIYFRPYLYDDRYRNCEAGTCETHPFRKPARAYKKNNFNNVHLVRLAFFLFDLALNP